MSPSKTPTRTKYTVFSLVMALIVNGMVVRDNPPSPVTA